MQYLVNVLDDRTASGTEEEAVAIDAFNDRLRAGGHWVFAAGLADPSASRPRSGPRASGSSRRPTSMSRWS
jgi:hypothetical protein